MRPARIALYYLDMRIFKSKLLPALLTLLLVAATQTVSAARSDSGFIGLEFLGSPQLSRVELEKHLTLRPGASYESAQKALVRLRQRLDQRHINVNADIVPSENGSFFIVVDVIETGLSHSLPTRKLQNPHHVYLSNEKPFTLLEQLQGRLDKLLDEGREANESYKDGVKVFSDQPSQNIAEQEVKELAGQQRSLHAIIGTDPNPNRRASAIELLNFTPDWVRNCRALIAAVDDSDVKVRAAAAKYIWARTKDLPDDFPFADLVEALSRQLSRPSHSDRARALACLISICKRDTDAITAVKEFGEQKLREISANSVVPEIQIMSKQLLKAASNPPPLKRVERAPATLNDYGSGF